jgi:hypothetical protein
MAALAAMATVCERPRDCGRAAVDVGCDSALVKDAEGGAACDLTVDRAGIDSLLRAAWWRCGICGRCGWDGRSFCACDAVVTLLGLCGFEVGVVALECEDCWLPMAYSGGCECAPAVSWTCDKVHLSTQVRMRRDTGIDCSAAASPIPSCPARANRDYRGAAVKASNTLPLHLSCFTRRRMIAPALRVQDATMDAI